SPVERRASSFDGWRSAGEAHVPGVCYRRQIRAPVSAAGAAVRRAIPRWSVPLLLHGKVFAYYGGNVGIGVGVDDETDWGEVALPDEYRADHGRSGSLTA